MPARNQNPSGETLADLLRRAQKRQGTESGRALSRRAAELGYDVSHTTLNKILADRGGNLSALTLDAVAALAEVPRSRAHVAAGRPAPGKPFADELPPEVDRLTRKQRDAVLGVVRVLLDESAETKAAPAKSPARPPSTLKAVARKRT
jgi:hypothetical protein